MNIGLVLSGGFAKGAYQVGALRALSNFIPPHEIKYFSCASIGALNGYAYATGHLDRVEDLWRGFCQEDDKLLMTKVLRSGALQDAIRSLHDDDCKLNSTFYCSMLDWRKLHLVYKDFSTVEGEKMPLYLKASVAMPVYNRAVQIEDAYYFDGATVDNVPVYPLLKHEDLDYIICIYLDDTSYRFESTRFDNKIIQVTFPSETMLKQALVLQRSSIEGMIQSGYDRTMEILSKVFAQGYENLDHIYSTIEEMNQNAKGCSLRITSDVLITNLNRVTKRLTKKKML